MNPAARTTAAGAQRLRDIAADCEARATELDSAAAAIAPPGASGYREADRAAHLSRMARRMRDKADRYRTRADRSVGILSVSDHAIVRYLERRYGLDVAAYAAELLPPDIADIAGRLGNGTYKCETAAGTHAVVVKGGCVVSVLV